MARLKKVETSPSIKFERIFKDEDETVIWKYDLDLYKSGPISVEVIPNKITKVTRTRKTTKLKTTK